MKKKGEKKNLPSTLFLKSKVLYKKKRKRIKINHSTIHTPNTNYYLKYL